MSALWIFLIVLSSGLIVFEFVAMPTTRAWLIGMNSFTIWLAVHGLIYEMRL